jgi:thymidylate synthase (FAD)
MGYEIVNLAQTFNAAQSSGVELVTAPWVRAINPPKIDPSAIFAFVEAHGLGGLADDPSTPIGRICDAVDFPADSNLTDADLLTEFAGRFCYRAWGKGRSTEDYIHNILAEGHGNVLAHATVSFIVTGVSRSLTHELIRHHVGTNPSQESQRYVTAEGGEIEIIGYRAVRAVVPPMILSLDGGHDRETLDLFRENYAEALENYHVWLDHIKRSLPAGMPATLRKKRANEAARCFLPNATETRLIWTMNLRAARNVIEQRGYEGSDLEIRRLAVAFTPELKRIAPNCFKDAEVYTAPDGFDAVRTEFRKV